MRKTIWIWVRRSLLAVGALVSLAFGALVIDGWAAFGRRAQGARQARMARVAPVARRQVPESRSRCGTTAGR